MVCSYQTWRLFAMMSFGICFASEHEGCEQIGGMECKYPPITESVSEETGLLQITQVVRSRKEDRDNMLLSAEAVTYVRHDGWECAKYAKDGGWWSHYVSPAECKSKCDADPECLSYGTLENSPPNDHITPTCYMGHGHCTEERPHPWFVRYAADGVHLRHVFSVILGSNRIVSVKGYNEPQDFKSYLNSVIIPLAAKQSKTFYSCDRGDTISMYVEFVNQKECAFMTSNTWKPDGYFDSWGQSGSSFVGFQCSNDSLSQHAFDVGINCSSCTQIAT